MTTNTVIYWTNLYDFDLLVQDYQALQSVVKRKFKLRVNLADVKLDNFTKQQINNLYSQLYLFDRNNKGVNKRFAIDIDGKIYYRQSNIYSTDKSNHIIGEV